VRHPESSHQVKGAPPALVLAVDLGLEISVEIVGVIFVYAGGGKIDVVDPALRGRDKIRSRRLEVIR